MNRLVIVRSYRLNILLIEAVRSHSNIQALENFLSRVVLDAYIFQLKCQLQKLYFKALKSFNTMQFEPETLTETYSKYLDAF